MKKTSKRFEERMQTLKEKAVETDVHVNPTKGVDSGLHGKDFETQVKYLLGNTNGRCISRNGRIDTRKTINGKLTTIEIKSGCGEIATLNEFGETVTSILNSDLIIYAPEYSPEYSVEQQAFVLEVDDFMEVLNNCGLTRLKKSSAQYKLDENEQFYDKMTIQSFTNSQRKTNLFYDYLEQYPTLKEWKEQNL